jgi:hypothetical protein
MSDKYKIITMSEESIGLGTVTTTFQVPLCKTCEGVYKSHKTKRLFLRIAAIILGIIAGNIITPLFIDDGEVVPFVSIAVGIVTGMIAARVYKVKQYPFLMDSLQQLHFKNKDYQLLFEQANPKN